MYSAMSMAHSIEVDASNFKTATIMEKEMKIILEGEKGIYTTAILGYAFLPFLFDDEPYCIRQLEQ